MPCELEYIPEHLHKNGRQDDQVFLVGEYLYFRIHPTLFPNPFASITLANLSVNRSGIENSISIKDDVLWNLNPEEVYERYNHDIGGFKIDSPTSNKSIKNPTIRVEIDDDSRDYGSIHLSHSPLECNYAHCDIDFTINGSIRVTKSNYKSTLGKHKKIRNAIRFKFHSALIQQKLDFNNN